MDRTSSGALVWEPAGTSLEPGGRNFGGFEVLRRVARCGATEVHLARRKDRHQVVALKRLRPVDRDVDDHRRALRAEGDFLLRVRHPGLCTVLEAGQVDDEPFLALEHLRGVTLAALQAHALRTRDPLDARLVLSIAVYTCRVVHWLHGLHEQTDGLVGGVHQALTPSHVFVTSSGAVKLLDLGAALDAPDQRLERIGLADQRYRAPEMRDGGAADPRADVYAIGSFVLESLAAGEAPWTAGSDVDPLRRDAGFFLDRAIADDPVRRFHDVAVLEHATLRVLARNGGLASATELGALVAALAEHSGRESSPEVAWPTSAEADAFADATCEIPLPGELARIDEAVDEVTLLAVRAAPGDDDDFDDPLADAPLAYGSSNDLPRPAGLALPAPPEEPMSARQRAKTAAAAVAARLSTSVSDAAIESVADAAGDDDDAADEVIDDVIASTEAPPPASALPDAPWGTSSAPVPAARRWRLALLSLGLAGAIAAAVLTGQAARALALLQGEPLAATVAAAAPDEPAEPGFFSHLLDPARLRVAAVVPAATDTADEASPFRAPAPTLAAIGPRAAALAPTPVLAAAVEPISVDPSPWQAVRRRWLSCVERQPCGRACEGRFSILIDGNGVPYSVESSTGSVPEEVTSCITGATRRAKDLRRLLVRMGVSELTWSPTSTRTAREELAAEAPVDAEPIN